MRNIGGVMLGAIADIRNSPRLEYIKKAIMSLPDFWQMSIYRIYYKVLIERNLFTTSEPEFSCLHNIISPGDWVIDIGANIGIYTKLMSDLVGNGGRVISIEPVLRNFFLLSSNAQLYKYQNVTLINLAASDAASVMGVDIPLSRTGRAEYSWAKLTSSKTEVETLTIRLDDLALPNRVALVKIDVETHEDHVIKGMTKLISRDHPILIVETQSDSVVHHLMDFGYDQRRLSNSPNIIFQWSA